MIANSLNIVLGLALVYAAVLDTPLFAGPAWRGVAVLAAFCFIALALLARRTDYARWHSILVNWLGGVLLAGVALSFLPAWPLTASTWICFWTGLLTAFLALWAVLYRRAAERFRATLAVAEAAPAESA
ncbi:hypothetical protein EPN52_09750 [bacterium]|nr:MAG: hypothetical protein EPN52_09750 [bacterium]